MRSRFTPPTIEELKAEIQKHDLPAEEAQRFMDYYESNGWRVGRNPMKSWTAAVSHWAGNSRRYRQNGDGSGISGADKIILSREMERIDMRLRDLRSDVYSDSERTERLALKARLEVIKQKLGVMI